MSINRVPIGSASGTANNQFHGQGQFCYYRKGSAVSGVTDVAVYVDSAYMGLMSPTEHFSLNQKGTFWEFKPVDPLLVGEFVLADTAEEYGSSAVAGTVAISSSPDNKFLYSSNGSAYTFCMETNGTTFNLFLVNLLGNTKTFNLTDVAFTTTLAVTGLTLDVYTYTGGTWSPAGGNSYLAPANKKTNLRDSGGVDSVSTTGVTGLNDESRIFIPYGVAANGNFSLRFDSPIILSPGEAIGISGTAAVASQVSFSGQFIAS